MNHPRAWASVSGLALFACAYALRTYVAFVGFPDGYVDQLRSAERSLFGVAAIECVAAGVLLLLLAAVPGDRGRPKAVAAILLLQAAFFAATIAVDAYYRHAFWMFMVG
jgi:hypothetical protein